MMTSLITAWPGLNIKPLNPELEYDEDFFNITNGDKNGATEFKTYEKKKKKTEW